VIAQNGQNIIMNIGGVNIGAGHPTFIIAELSANHNQNLQIAKDTIHAAKKAGVDAIKLQTYTADSITINSDEKYFRINQGGVWDGQTLYELYSRAFTPWEWQEELKELAESLDLVCFSSPFDKTAVDFLEDINVPAYKIASLEITDIPLIEYVASKGKPVILSSGVARLKDIEKAVFACRKAGNNQIAVLKCTSAYPSPLEQSNLRTIPDIASRFNVVSGLSDHSVGDIATISAVVLGANIIEKHIILNGSVGGPDAHFSLTAKQFTKMVRRIREVEIALGEVSYDLPPNVLAARAMARSLFVVKDVKAGDKITDDNVRSIRPGQGLPPSDLQLILGQAFAQDIKMGTPLKKYHIKNKRR